MRIQVEEFSAHIEAITAPERRAARYRYVLWELSERNQKLLHVSANFAGKKACQQQAEKHLKLLLAKDVA